MKNEEFDLSNSSKMKALQAETIITSLRALKDGGLSLTIHTPELSPEEKAEFMKLQNVYLDTHFIPKDMVNPPNFKIDKDLETKTPSQRLRAVLYVLFQQSATDKDFNEFYRDQMERFIEAVKDNLD